MTDRRHGGPADRGSADAYYWRPPEPHFYPGHTGFGPRITPPQMTDDEVAEYMAAYNAEDDRKDYA